MKKIAHLTSVHPRYDVRIFVKECSSLAKKYQVNLIVADGNGDEIINDIQIHDVGKFNGRLNRMLKATQAVFQKAKFIDADIYHLHDPELIPIGLKLKKLGKKVIFDAHEDLPNQIKAKHYLHPVFRSLLSMSVKYYEQYACSRLDGIIVAAEPIIKDKFLAINPKTEDINNYPKLEELADISESKRINNQICYVGGITRVRGIIEMVKAIQLTEADCQLVIAGNFSDSSLEAEVKSLPGWKRVKFLGYVDRAGIRNIMETSCLGLVTLHPTDSYLNSMPIKMFEYMCSGMPVVSSDFPLWQKIINDSQSGKFVDPLDSLQIAKAIDFYLLDKEESLKAGQFGREFVLKKYNWANEEEKLFNFYDDILGRK
ncbi:glycosyltransferase [Acinetobacter sp. WCHA55]|uniref:glycosyltransferase n=1 Tax=Acinetobacter sp. WCHA55 TaxID=2004646 RepID=UPI000B3C06FE|nr:glycosyltransferase [Acinetobacter sp. WCHA55]AYA70199.1 glycosyltransferase [Acinetobacter sp. WCHA55]